jgi:hypothetical protein
MPAAEPTATVTPALHPSNVLGSPGSTWAGASSLLLILGRAMETGMPQTPQGWIAFGVAVVTSIGAIFSRA